MNSHPIQASWVGGNVRYGLLLFGVFPPLIPCFTQTLAIPAPPLSHVFRYYGVRWGDVWKRWGWCRCGGRNRRAMEFSRNGRSSKQRTHGTQCIDRIWRSLKSFMPRDINSKSQYVLKNTYVWAFVRRTNTWRQKRLHALGRGGRRPTRAGSWALRLTHVEETQETEMVKA